MVVFILMFCGWLIVECLVGVFLVVVMMVVFVFFFLLEGFLVFLEWWMVFEVDVIMVEIIGKLLFIVLVMDVVMLMVLSVLFFEFFGVELFFVELIMLLILLLESIIGVFVYWVKGIV